MIYSLHRLGSALLLCGVIFADFGVENRTVTIGIQNSPASTLLMVAADAGFFKKRGLDVELKEFTAGKFALQAFLGGSLDAVASGEVPVLLAAQQGIRLIVVSQIVENTKDGIRLVVRRDNGLENTPHDYFISKRRIVATSLGGGPEYFTFVALKSLNINLDNVTLVSQRPEDMVAAITTKSVDAISIFDPFAAIAESELNGEGASLQIDSGYQELYLLSVSEKLIGNNSKVAEQMLRALHDASDYIIDHPAKAKSILVNRTKLNSKLIDSIWTNFSFRIGLSKRLLNNWNDQLKWLATKGTLAPNAQPVAPRSLINESFLKAVSPQSVSVDQQ